MADIRKHDLYKSLFITTRSLAPVRIQEFFKEVDESLAHVKASFIVRDYSRFRLLFNDCLFCEIGLVVIVVVKWSSCLPSTWTIQVRIQIKSYCFIL